MESQQDWYAPLRSLTSRGSKTEVKGGLAGLHDARREHLGQFFTPDAIAANFAKIGDMSTARDLGGAFFQTFKYVEQAAKAAGIKLPNMGG